MHPAGTNQGNLSEQAVTALPGTPGQIDDSLVQGIDQIIKHNSDDLEMKYFFLNKAASDTRTPPLINLIISSGKFIFTLIAEFEPQFF